MPTKTKIFWLISSSGPIFSVSEDLPSPAGPGRYRPVFFFHVWNWSTGSAGNNFFYWKLFHIGIIALAGTIGNVRLWHLLESIAGRIKAKAVLLAWLFANLFLGCQLSWILRPFFGNPNIEVTFLREDALGRSFYEDVWVILQGLWAQIS